MPLAAIIARIITLIVASIGTLPCDIDCKMRLPRIDSDAISSRIIVWASIYVNPRRRANSAHKDGAELPGPPITKTTHGLTVFFDTGAGIQAFQTAGASGGKVPAKLSFFAN